MARNGELGTFLRTRRARLRPEDVGMEPGGVRRVPGLRREEVAMLAGVSADYLTRLEQGRDLQPSDGVLDALARALRLAEVERRHLHGLVRARVATPPGGDLVLPPLDSGARLVVDALPMPALVVDLRGDVHAMNRLGEALLVGLEPTGNHARWLFLDPAARELLVEWEALARTGVSVLREAAGRHPHDRALQAVIGELAVGSPAFARWWAEHDVDVRCRGEKRFRHPVVGELVVHTEALALQDGERWLYAYAVEPGSPSAEALALLGSWAATQDAELPGAPCA